MATTYPLFATAAKGIEDLLADELRALGADAVVPQRAGVSFTATLADAYRACLWSRLASRILLPVAAFAAPTPQALYDGVRGVRWLDHIDAHGTLAVDFTASQSALSHSHYGALKTKDAIVDQLRDATGVRPTVDLRRPSVRVNVYLHRDHAVVSIDLSGDSLHRRAYRRSGAAAPLKENLAAAVLVLAEWPQRACDGVPLLDPMCGSGTLLIEAAWMAADIAPGIGRSYFGFFGWRGHQPALWQRLRAEAEERGRRDRRVPPIRGSDADGRAVRAALANIEAAGLRGHVQVERRALAECTPIAARGGGEVRGLVVTNPPYGERIGDVEKMGALYAQLGDVLRRGFPGWVAHVLAGNPQLGKQIGLRPARRHVLYNGTIECRLLSFPISSAPVRSGSGPGWRTRAVATATELGQRRRAAPPPRRPPRR